MSNIDNSRTALSLYAKIKKIISGYNPQDPIPMTYQSANEIPKPESNAGNVEDVQRTQRKKRVSFKEFTHNMMTGKQ
jgi:hypothetical protein